MAISYIYQKSQHCNCRKFEDNMKLAVPTNSSQTGVRSVVIYGFFFLYMSAPVYTVQRISAARSAKS